MGAWEHVGSTPASRIMTVRTATFGGIRYDIDLCGPIDGCCDQPKGGRPALMITTDLNTKNGLISLIHECLHALAWSVDEDKVNQVSKDVGRLLWRLGYRPNKQ